MMIPNYDFLALSLANQISIEPFEFSFASGKGRVEETGILRLEPSTPSEVSLVLSVGIHGNETGPIEVVNQLVKSILRGKLTLGVRMLVLIGSPVAANQAKRFCEVNLNRLFCGAWQQFDGYEAKRAQRLEKAVTDFYALPTDQTKQIRLHYDLHTAIRGSEHEKFAVYPFIENAVYSKTQLGFLAACDVGAILFSHQPTTTFSYYSQKIHGAHAFTVELGKVFPFGQNDLSRFDGIKTALTLLLETGNLAQSPVENLSLFRVLDSLIKEDESYELNIAQDVKNFTPFEVGFVLATSAKSHYCIKQTGDAIVFPNTQLPIGQRAGLMVRPLKMDDLALF
ncbi:succinylglutamate desuccinylase [Marinomonas sp. IMCC 4694]|uniref:succinylglutamate desuccinylase n=1 Tax=Marinomonas sp. IMCC 4694 TaxID=2605432 RepID=UPI0011E70D76|nr:succinylglutamate desuccinylase [Marinomonas sp. IMCC 4694]TYL48576.1 succinylglutamate desuccinylase [Marinomonas sp. IMCC 4694]